MDKNIKILLVDDSAFMRNVLKNILTHEGFSNFSEAEDGQEALDKIATIKPDIVLLDIIMPKTSGLEVVEKMGKEVKIIVVSAVGQEKIIEEAKEYGAMGYIVKPFDNEQVIEEVKLALETD